MYSIQGYVLIVIHVPCLCNDNAERPTKRQKLVSEDGAETLPVSDTPATSQTAAHGKWTEYVRDLLNK